MNYSGIFFSYFNFDDSKTFTAPHDDFVVYAEESCFLRQQWPLPPPLSVTNKPHKQYKLYYFTAHLSQLRTSISSEKGSFNIKSLPLSENITSRFQHCSWMDTPSIRPEMIQMYTLFVFFFIASVISRSLVCSSQVHRSAGYSFWTQRL